jgi:ubiquinone/menaquinone biosynthesis C-methylase UbiE/diadenosine tetraphosphate (Ap4A) HIT family hydrolase
MPGYMLLMPRRHVRSLGELTLAELEHVIDAAWAMAHSMTRTFGGSFVLIEHGSSGNGCTPNGACIEHAHMHVFPLSSGADIYQFRLAGSRRLQDLSQIRKLAQCGRNYYLVGVQPGECYLLADPVLVSQHARRKWAKAIGREDEWDWGACPFTANVRLTATRLRRDDLLYAELGLRLDDADLSETLNAYNEAAEWYASRTSKFPPGSSLKAEMDRLVSRTQGAILDAGTGGGRDAHYLAEHDRPVIALDASSELLAQVAPHKNLLRVIGDVRELQFVDESFGAVWCSAVLLHLNPEGVIRSLREFYRVVNCGGLVQISVKEGHGQVSSSIGRNPRLRRHFFLYRESDLRQFAHLSGFNVLEYWAEEQVDSTETVQRWIKMLMQRPA